MLIEIGPKFYYNIFALILCSVAFSCIRRDKKRVNIIKLPTFKSLPDNTLTKPYICPEP